MKRPIVTADTGLARRSTLANAGEFAYDQAFIMATAFIAGGLLWKTLML
ncbi:hypothetical protein [Mesorhizobium sp.]|nr:hypothetical protein [Mesorhizobium sp.]